MSQIESNGVISKISVPPPKASRTVANSQALLPGVECHRYCRMFTTYGWSLDPLGVLMTIAS